MPLHLTCPSCGAKGRLPDAASGKTARCPNCGTKLVVPTKTDTVPVDELDFFSARSDGPKQFNPFDEGSEMPAVESPQPKRRYTGGFNPFGDEATPDEPVCDVDDPFDYTVAEPHNQVESFEFGPTDVFTEDHSVKKKRRKTK